jgi:electron transfer flavoprotein alpha subunit
MILVFAETSNGQFRKSTFEAINYAASIAKNTNDTVAALVLGECSNPNTLGEYGATEIVHLNDARFNHVDSNAYAKAIVETANSTRSNLVICSNTITGKAVAPNVAANLEAGIVSGAISLPDTSNGFVIKKGVFSGKAFAFVNIKSERKVIALSPNTFAIQKMETVATVKNISTTLQDKDFAIKTVSVQKAGGTISLSEAELVVSAGRGLKGPENWGMVEETANLLGAALACSRPVADSHWRPHHEHVGQTGGTIKPNLYIAIGISGAIQHLAGVNSSKTIVVINKDAEAPFFKAADYGVLGDAFEIVPKLNEAIKKFKTAQNA